LAKPVKGDVITPKAIAAVAFIATIQWAEGTADVPDPYRTRYTFEQVPKDIPLDAHPYWTDKRIPCGVIGGRNVCSAATGALQWMPDTWDAALKACGDRLDPRHPQFSPVNQDRIGLCWVEQTRALSELFKGLKILGGQPIVDRDSFNEAMFKSCGEWASIPCHETDENGAHNQGARQLGRLWERFQAELEKRR
jgi:muramidase (phage lysozyme)